MLLKKADLLVSQKGFQKAATKTGVEMPLLDREMYY